MNRYIFVLVAILSVACAAKLDWRIIGGSTAEDGQFPYQVSIRLYGNSHSCGGCILNEKWILTAAHCVDGYSPVNLKIVTGSNKLHQGGDTYYVERMIYNRDFDEDKMINDIALVKVYKRIAFNAKVQPIPLETADVPAGADVVLSGWGLTSNPGYPPEDLQFLPLKAISSEDCDKRHGGSSVGPTQLCTLTKTGEGACRGDSGGPLVHNGKVAGVVSWGEPCAIGYPDVFTRVSSFVDWINKTMED